MRTNYLKFDFSNECASWASLVTILGILYLCLFKYSKFLGVRFRKRILLIKASKNRLREGFNLVTFSLFVEMECKHAIIGGL